MSSHPGFYRPLGKDSYRVTAWVTCPGLGAEMRKQTFSKACLGPEGCCFFSRGPSGMLAQPQLIWWGQSCSRRVAKWPLSNRDRSSIGKHNPPQACGLCLDQSSLPPTKTHHLWKWALKHPCLFWEFKEGSDPKSLYKRCQSRMLSMLRTPQTSRGAAWLATAWSHFTARGRGGSGGAHSQHTMPCCARAHCSMCGWRKGTDPVLPFSTVTCSRVLPLHQQNREHNLATGNSNSGSLKQEIPWQWDFTLWCSRRPRVLSLWQQEGCWVRRGSSSVLELNFEIRQSTLLLASTKHITARRITATITTYVCTYVVVIWSLLIQGLGEKYRNRKWKLREPFLLIVGLFPRLFFLPTWLQCTMNILGVQNSSNIVVPPWKLAASAQWLVFILVKETNVNECRWAADKSLLREKGFIPTALLPSASPIFKEGKGDEPMNWMLPDWYLGRWWSK